MRNALDIARSRLRSPSRTYYRCLGAYIAGLRESQGIEQTAMAEALGISQSAYSRLETGNSRCTVEQFEQIAEKLGVSVTQILKGARELRETR